LRLQLVNANRRARAIGDNELTARTNYFIGSDPARWNRNVRNYERVKVEQAYRGVDMVYYGSGGRLEYDFNVAPGADHRAIRLRVVGARRMSIDKSGDLLIETTAGQLRQHRPTTYQVIGGLRRAIPAHYALTGKRELRFVVDRFDERLPMVIDPVLSYSTFFGGQGSDMPNGVAVDAVGNVYIAGGTYSVDFPPRAGVHPTNTPRYSDVFIAKLNPSGSDLIYSTLVGGIGVETGIAIAVDDNGSAFVTGTTSSIDFPTTPGAVQTGLAGGWNSDAFVVRLTGDGSLSFSTCLGGSGEQTFAAADYGYGIALDSSGNAYVTGRTDSIDFPTTPGAFQQTHKTLPDAFVAKVNATGTTLLYSTYLGGGNADEGIGIATDFAGNAYVTGYTSSADFPVTAGALQTQLGSDSRVALPMSDAFIAKLNAGGSSLVYSTYLGGFRLEIGNAIAVDSEGTAYVVGATQSPNFPTTEGSAKHLYEGGFYRSGNAGQGWRLRNSGLAVPVLRGLVADPKTPTNLFLSSDEGLYKSSDGGNSWSTATPIPFTDLVIDPVNPSILYGGFARVSKSTDGGVTWAAADDGLPTQFSTRQLLIDRLQPSTLYATGVGFLTFSTEKSVQTVTPLDEPPPTPRFFFKSTDGGGSWHEIFSLPLFQLPSSVAMDPQDSARLFVSTAGPLFRTQNGGESWRLMNNSAFYAPLVVDPKTNGTLYGLAQGVAKSTDDGQTWVDINNGLPDKLNPYIIAALPTTPTTLYIASELGVFKSVDAGASWQPSPLAGPVSFLAFNPQDTSTVYGGVNDPSDAFVARLNSTGSALLYCTYLGGRGGDQALDIAIDRSGNAYVTGTTYSDTFATRGAFQTQKPRTIAYTAFVTKLNGDGRQLLFSTYFGGTKDITAGQSIALGPSGDAYVAGWTASPDIPIKSAFQSAFSGGDFDGFLFKLGAPRITNVISSGKKLFVEGENFDQGATLLVNGEEQNTAIDVAAPPSTRLIGKKAAKRIPRGQTARIRVRNSDATLSNEVMFTRPVE
jgi:photosystem II stability/assembly factor-like uncharacterized protein